MAAKQRMITAVFRDRLNADAGWNWLTAHGYGVHEINMLMSENTKAKYYSPDGEDGIGASTHAAEGMATGGVIGTAVGATAAAIAAIGTTILIPGLGIVVAGPLAAALAGAGAGAVAGGILGWLIGLGIPESNAKAYEQVLRDGGVVLGVAPHDSKDASDIKERFEQLKGENIVTI
jgi:hypothetical protein